MSVSVNPPTREKYQLKPDHYTQVVVYSVLEGIFSDTKSKQTIAALLSIKHNKA